MRKDKRDTLRAEYERGDLGPGARGKYAAQYAKGTKLVLLDADVAAAFPTELSVNEALRSLLELARRASSRANPEATPPASE